MSEQGTMSEQAVFDALKYRVEVDIYGNRWYYNSANQSHRTDGPAIEWSNGNKSWYQYGLRHRTDGAAMEYTTGSEAWYLNGLRHRADGPAVEYADGYKAWYQNGLRHRTDGPAVEYTNGYKEWYINGEELTEAEFNQRVKNV